MQFKIKKFKSLSSTQDRAKELASQGHPKGTVIVSETQAKGRGRSSRKWISNKGGLYFSIILNPQSKDIPFLVLKPAISVCDSLRKLGINAELKWPNDILVNGKKIAGILLESKLSPISNQVFIGIGINVNNPLSPQIKNTATTLKRELNKEIPIESLLTGILKNFSRDLKLTNAKTIAEWKKRNCIIGKKVKIQAPTGRIAGIAVDIDDDCSLIVRQKNRSTCKITVGYVNF